MGNHCCVIHGSSSMAVWAEDDWGPNTSESMVEKEGLLGGCKESSSTTGTSGNQVRIRISKKELEELLKKVDNNNNNKSGSKMKKMKANQVLQTLIDKSDHFEIHNNNQRSWMPALQSIPEVN